MSTSTSSIFREAKSLLSNQARKRSHCNILNLFEHLDYKILDPYKRKIDRSLHLQDTQKSFSAHTYQSMITTYILISFLQCNLPFPASLLRHSSYRRDLRGLRTFKLLPFSPGSLRHTLVCVLDIKTILNKVRACRSVLLSKSFKIPENWFQYLKHSFYVVCTPSQFL